MTSTLESVIHEGPNQNDGHFGSKVTVAARRQAWFPAWFSASGTVQSFIVYRLSFIVHRACRFHCFRRSSFYRSSFYRSSFIAHRSSFKRRSRLGSRLRESFSLFLFIVHRPSSIVHRLSCIVHRSSLIVPRSWFLVHRSSFIVPRSPFTDRRPSVIGLPSSLAELPLHYSQVPGNVRTFKDI